MRCTLTTSHADYRRENGQDVVEFALILPLLLLLIFGIVEFGIVMFSYNTISNAAREGARVSVISGATTDEIVAAVQALAPGLGLTAANITLSAVESSTKVEVAYDYHIITGPIAQAVGDPVIHLHTSATMRRE
jgi:Flp pilus assembly protein TadG